MQVGVFGYCPASFFRGLNMKLGSNFLSRKLWKNSPTWIRSNVNITFQKVVTIANFTGPLQYSFCIRPKLGHNSKKGVTIMQIPGISTNTDANI